jgi:hypothetical protein
VSVSEDSPLRLLKSSSFDGVFRLLPKNAVSLDVALRNSSALFGDTNPTISCGRSGGGAGVMPNRDGGLGINLDSLGLCGAEGSGGLSFENEYLGFAEFGEGSDKENFVLCGVVESLAIAD